MLTKVSHRALRHGRSADLFFVDEC